MGGKILEYEAKTILRAGFQEGRQEGRLESLADIILNMRNMKKKGYSVALIADATDKKPGRLAPVRFFVTYYEALF